jgi:hypothetical protein
MPIRVSRRVCGVPALVAILITFVAFQQSNGQEPPFTHGQNVVPSYEGFEGNPDGTFNLVFGYLNRNYEELLDIPIGPANNIEPGGPDQGQPTHFLPRRRRFEFRIKVPKDFGSKEVVWTLTSGGKTEKAYGTLKPDYILDNRVMMMNASSFGQRGNEGDNQPPVVTVEGGTRRTGKVGEPLSLVATVTDDGIPAPPPLFDQRGGSRAAGVSNSAAAITSNRRARDYGVRAAWYVYRSAGSVTFEPEQLTRPYPAGTTVPSPLPKDGRVSVRATFGAPGTYVLRAMGDDMALQSTQDVTVTIIP